MRGPYLHEGRDTIVNFAIGVPEFAQENGMTTTKLIFNVREDTR